MKNNFLLFTFLFGIIIASTCCTGQTVKVKDKTSNNTHTDEQVADDFVPNDQKDSLYFHPKFFNLLSKNLVENGEIETVNASSRIDKPVYLNYHRLTHKNLILTVDNSNRIYFCRLGTQEKVGNILKTENNVVKIECDNEQVKNEIYIAYTELLQKLTVNNTTN